MVPELLVAMLPFPHESQILWCIRKSTSFCTIRDRQGGTLRQWTWTIHSAVLLACSSCTYEPTQCTEGSCPEWPCTRSNSQHPSNLKLILSCSHNQGHFLIHVLSRRRKIGIRKERNVQHKEQRDTNLPLNALPRSLMELFLSRLIVSKTPFRVKFHHPSMSLSETPTSIAICLQTDRASLLKDRSSSMSGNLIFGKMCSFTVVCRYLKLPALETACPCWAIARLTTGAGTGVAGPATWGATIVAGPTATGLVGVAGGIGAARGAARGRRRSGAGAGGAGGTPAGWRCATDPVRRLSRSMGPFIAASFSANKRSSSARRDPLVRGDGEKRWPWSTTRERAFPCRVGVLWRLLLCWRVLLRRLLGCVRRATLAVRRFFVCDMSPAQASWQESGVIRKQVQEGQSLTAE